MKKLIFLGFLIIPASLQAGGLVSTSTVFEIRADATAGNINGCGYSIHDIPTPGIDYSKQITAQKTITDLVIGGAGSENTVSSTLTPFDANDPGNVLHITAGTGFTAGWYTIRSVSAGVATLVSAAGTAGSSAGTAQLGGACSLNSTLDDAFFENWSASNTAYVFQGGGIVSAGQVISIATAACNNSTPCRVEGYFTARGDAPNSIDTMPMINLGASAYSGPMNLYYLNTEGTAATVVTFVALVNNHSKGIKVTNTSSTVARNAIGLGTSNSDLMGSEVVCQNGTGVLSNTSVFRIVSNYIHDTSTGFSSNVFSSHMLMNNLFEANSVSILLPNTGGLNSFISGNTFYGTEAKYGIGFSANSILSVNLIGTRFFNNIWYGLGVARTNTANKSENMFSENDNYFNNTTNVINNFLGPTDTLVDPQFANAKQITGTTGSTSGSVLTQSGGDFSTVVDTFSFLHVTVGGGATVGCYRVVKHDNTTLTVNNALGTGSNTVYFVTTGHNFTPGPNMKGTSYPRIFGSSVTLNYTDMGAVQRPEPQRAILTGGK